MGNDRKEVTHHPGKNPHPREKTLITSVGFTAGVNDRFEVYWLIPDSDEEAEKAYKCKLKDLVEAGVRQLSTRPNYKDVGFAEDGSLKEGGHEAMQVMASGYEMGRRVAGPGAKQQAAKMKAITAGLAELGIDADAMGTDEIIAAVKARMKKGKKE
jgi:hypothetical protein